MPATFKEELEDTIDRMGIAKFLEAIETICFEKADHVQSAWQDAALAKAWSKVGNKIGLAVVTARNIQ
jgi:hypothetical protein